MRNIQHFFPFGILRLIWNQSEFNPPGHSSVLQSRELADVPGHALPPYAGLGLLHSRFLPCRPPPQLFEHSLHEPQLPQFPSTTKKMDGRDIIKTSFIFQQFLLDKHWIFDAYFCYIALPLTLLWLIQPKFLTFTNTTSSLALEILERGKIAVTLFLVVSAFLCAESIAV